MLSLPSQLLQVSVLQMIFSSPKSPSVKAASKLLNRQVNMGKKKRRVFGVTPHLKERRGEARPCLEGQRGASPWFPLTPTVAAGRMLLSAAGGWGRAVGSPGVVAATTASGGDSAPSTGASSLGQVKGSFLGSYIKAVPEYKK